MNTELLDRQAIRRDLERAAEELIREARYTRAGDIFVLGCSTSEVIGLTIGRAICR